MINLIEEEYDSASGKYILHLTMGTEDTLSDLPSAEKPFNSSNYSCFFDYGEPAENSSAVDEESGEIYLYSNGEWIEPEPAGDAKILVFGEELTVGGVPVSENGYALGEPGDVVEGLIAELEYDVQGVNKDTLELDNIELGMTGVTTYTLPEGYVYINIYTT